jgi:serine/threonine protein kinase
MNKHPRFHQPHLARILVAGIFLAFNKRFYPKRAIEQHIGEFRLVREFIKDDVSDRSFVVGEYTDGIRNYFIKTWHGYFKDTNYFNLRNEYLVNEVIQSHFKETKGQSHVTTPQVITCIESDHSFSVVFEFVEGKTLDTYPLEFQVKTLGSILEALETVSCELRREHHCYFAHRGLVAYLVSLPIIVIIAIVRNPRHFRKILITTYSCIRFFFRSYTPTLTLAHRDIGPDNIIVGRDGIYLLDFERIALTYPLYDITSLGVEPTYRDIVLDMKKNFMYIEDDFLKSYIILRRAAFTGGLYE